MSLPMTKNEKEATTKQNFLQLLRKCEFANFDNDPDCIQKLKKNSESRTTIQFFEFFRQTFCPKSTSIFSLLEI